MKRKYKIIVVENDEDELLFLKEGFNSVEEFELITMLKNGNALFEWLNDNANNLPDVILSDLNMPGKNGYDVLEGIRSDARYAHIPVVISSTSSTRSTIAKCMELGATEFLVKPDTFINYEPFLKQLYNILEAKNLSSN
jgi:CheY-like chemotaxis protein